MRKGYGYEDRIHMALETINLMKYDKHWNHVARAGNKKRR